MNHATRLHSSNYWYLRRYLTPKKHVLKQVVICAALGRLRWSL